MIAASDKQGGFLEPCKWYIEKHLFCFISKFDPFYMPALKFKIRSFPSNNS